MKLTSTVKLPGPKQYEMHYVSAEMELSDIPSELRDKLSIFDMWHVMQFVVHRETILAAAAKGLISIDLAHEQSEAIKQLVPESVRRLVKEHGL